MWRNRNSYNGLSVLPFNGGTYTQTPFEKITEDRYNEMCQFLKKIDLTQVIESENNTDAKGEIVCSGGVCDLTF